MHTQLIRQVVSRWGDVEADMILLSREGEKVVKHPKEIVRENALHILRPVLLYLFCDPNHHSHVDQELVRTARMS